MGVTPSFILAQDFRSMTLYFSNSFEHTIFYIIWRFLMNTFKKYTVAFFRLVLELLFRFFLTGNQN